MAASMRTCERCERAIPMGLGVCPHCGKPQSGPRRRADLARIALAILLAVAVLMIAHRLGAR